MYDFLVEGEKMATMFLSVLMVFLRCCKVGTEGRILQFVLS